MKITEYHFSNIL